MAEMLSPANTSGRPGKKLLTWGIVAVVLLALIVPGCSNYNNMNKMSKDVDAAWAQVQVQYQRRSDLIPNLVNSVKRNVKPLSMFWNLKKKALGVTKLHLYDANAPITKMVTHHYSVDEAKD